MIKSTFRRQAIGGGVVAIAATAALIVTQPQWRPSAPTDHQYLLALYSAPNNPGGNAKEYGAWARAHHTGRARVIGGDELAPAVATLGAIPPAGPELVGFFRVSADSDADAIALAKSTPHLRHGGAVTIRPTVE